MTARKKNSIKDLSESYLEASKDEMVCVYDRYAGYVDGAKQVLDMFEKKFESAKFYSDMSFHSRFFREVQELIQELKGGEE